MSRTARLGVRLSRAKESDSLLLRRLPGGRAPPGLPGGAGSRSGFHKNANGPYGRQRNFCLRLFHAVERLSLLARPAGRSGPFRFHVAESLKADRSRLGQILRERRGFFQKKIVLEQGLEPGVVVAPNEKRLADPGALQCAIPRFLHDFPRRPRERADALALRPGRVYQAIERRGGGFLAGMPPAQSLGLDHVGQHFKFGSRAPPRKALEHGQVSRAVLHTRPVEAPAHEASLSYIKSTSRSSAGDHSLSAIAARRGQMRESTVSAFTSSAHMHASPPRMRAASSAFSC